MSEVSRKARKEGPEMISAQTTPAAKVWSDCTYCDGTGLTKTRFQRGFFMYEPGRTCPECTAKHQDELKRASDPYNGATIVRSGIDDVRRAARLEALEEAAKIAEARAAEGEYGTWQGQEGKIIAAAIRERAKG